MPDYKSSTSRLKRLFEEGRERWKQKALERQKKLRSQEIKIRDLSNSREKWKERVRELEARVEELEKAKGEEEESNEEGETEAKAEVEKAETEKAELEARAKGHSYPLHVMQLSIEQVVESLTSLRGSSKTWAVFGQYYEMVVPSYTSIRSWMLRVGLYLLNQRCEKRSDWIFIVDHTVELGQNKCLIMLGVKGEELKEGSYALAHQDVALLGLEVLPQSTGEIMEEKIRELAEKVGTPKQIVADEGSDIKKGIELYQAQEPEVIYTYDVTHKMAALLKAELKDDEQWNSFLKACGTHSSTLQQSALYFLAPPRQRTKARYSSVAPQIRWAEQVLAYQQVGDYSQIDPTFMLDEQTLSCVREQYPPHIVAALKTMTQTHFSTRDAFAQALIAHIGLDDFRHIQALICRAADMGRRKFDAKLAWVAEYAEGLPHYTQMIDIIDLVQTQLKHHGLHRRSLRQFKLALLDFDLLPTVRPFVTRICHYLSEQTQPFTQQDISLRPSQPLLATSDIIESIIGKYKLFSAQRPIRDVGSLILTIPLFTTKLSLDLINDAMLSVKALDVECWAKKLFGPSTLAKRRSLPHPSFCQHPFCMKKQRGYA